MSVCCGLYQISPTESWAVITNWRVTRLIPDWNHLTVICDLWLSIHNSPPNMYKMIVRIISRILMSWWGDRHLVLHFLTKEKFSVLTIWIFSRSERCGRLVSGQWRWWSCVLSWYWGQDYKGRCEGQAWSDSSMQIRCCSSQILLLILA